ncbi:MAG: methyltransferase domain-containing protein [Myxococcales bacterium]|nr:methyltransferase domain-containing protein [Myxococcales bacterium]
MTEREVPRPITAHYITPGYLGRSRWISYHQQFALLRAVGARRILEIGPGPGIVTAALRACGLDVVTADIDHGTRPDVVADVRRLDEAFPPASFDAVAAFEVLEHLTREDARVALDRMARVSRSHVVISLPYAGVTLRFVARLFEIDSDRPLRIGWRVPAFWRARPMCHEHRWEPGLRGCSLASVRRMLEGACVIEREERLAETGDQVFFVLRKR